MPITNRVSEFVQSAVAESKKVTWPSRQELIESTQVVVVASFIVMIFLFVVDRALSFGLGFFIR